MQNLIAFGQTLLLTLQASPAAEIVAGIAGRFGINDVARIIARVTRGLMLAAGLETRLARGAKLRNTPRPRAAALHTPATVPPARAGRSATVARQDDDAALLAALPTAQEIAAQLRRRPIGEVLAWICHDLGITCDHPLWRELNQAILHNGGNLVRVLDGMQARVTAGWTYLAAVADTLSLPPLWPPLVAASLAPGLIPVVSPIATGPP